MSKQSQDRRTYLSPGHQLAEVSEDASLEAEILELVWEAAEEVSGWKNEREAMRAHAVVCAKLAVLLYPECVLHC